MKNQIFGVLQRVGRSFMLPIAILPIAGLLLGIGIALTNETMINSYQLNWILGDGTIINSLLVIMKKVGSGIFDNLPLIFAAGVALGMAKKEKEVAVLSSLIAFFVMHMTINALLCLDHQVLSDNTLAASVLNGTITNICGIFTLEMGVFGGIIVGLGVAFLHNRYYRIELPSAISFFGGTRFIPIVSTICFIVVGIIMFYTWPIVQNAIYALGGFVSKTGYLGTLIFGIVKRLLVPFGLHHVFYLPFWQTAVGGSMLVDGILIHGGQNIFFAQLADPSVVHFSSDATRYFSGEFIFMIFGLPGAALAMYHCAKDKYKKLVGGLLLSAALTSILTGITEPIEFTFLFVAPILFGTQVILAGSAYMIAHILNIAVGLTFSGGLIDLMMFGVMQGNQKTSWILLLPVGIIYFGLYYGIFKFLILKYNLPTLGRGDGKDIEILLAKELSNDSETKSQENDYIVDHQSVLIVKGLGGRNNFKDIDCCVTRLRATIINSNKLDESILKQSGAAGIIRRGNCVQIIYGPKASIIKSKLEEYLDNTVIDNIDDNQVLIVHENIELKNIVDGEVRPISEACDEIFSRKIMGDGIMIIPHQELIVAPCKAKVSMVFPTGHAIGLKLENGCEILLHFGVNTVGLNGVGFEILVENEQLIDCGTPIWKVDLEYIKKNAISENIMMIFTALPDNIEIVKKYGVKRAGETILLLKN